MRTAGVWSFEGVFVYALDGPASERVFQRFRSDPAGARILAERCLPWWRETQVTCDHHIRLHPLHIAG